MVSVRKTESMDGFPSGAAYRGGKAPKKWSFTARDIGAAVGLTPQQVLKLAGKKGCFDPSDLASLAAFVVDRQGKEGERCAHAVLVAASQGTEAAATALGISQATLYRRAKAHEKARLPDILTALDAALAKPVTP